MANVARGKRATWAAGGVLLALVLGAPFSRELAVRYHCLRLRWRPATIVEGLEAKEEDPRRAALARFAATREGQETLLEHPAQMRRGRPEEDGTRIEKGRL